MIKSKELADPNSCMNRAKDDEMTFVLLGRDKAAPVAIRAWINERLRLGKNTPEDEQIKGALADVLRMEIKIFSMNDCDWMAAATVEEATEKYLEHTGMTAQEAFDGEEPTEVSEHCLAGKKFCEEDGTKKTFREKLDEMISAGEKFPCFFASTEF